MEFDASKLFAARPGDAQTYAAWMCGLAAFVLFVWAMVSVGLQADYFYPAGTVVVEYPPFAYTGPAQVRVATGGPGVTNASGVYMPCVNGTCWGAAWFAALSLSANATAPWLIVGGDVALGYAAAAPAALGAAALLQLALARDFADGGSGRFSIAASDVVDKSWDAQYGLAQTGVYSAGTNWTLSSGDAWHGGAVAYTVNATLQVCGRGDSVQFTLAQGANVFNVVIDAMPPLMYSVNVTAAFAEFALALGTGGPHCVNVTSIAGLGLASWAFTVLGRGAWPDNNAAHGFVTSQLAGAQALQYTGGAGDPRPLAVFMPDYHSAGAEALGAFTNNSQALLQSWLAQNSSILIVRPFVLNENDDDPVYASYLAQTAVLAAWCTAAAPACALVDFVELWSAGQVLDAQWLSVSGVDAPSSYLLSGGGHLAMAAALYPLLTAQVALPCC